MQLILQTDDMDKYLDSSEIIDFENLDIQKTALSLSKDVEDEIQLIKTVYEFVRDDISKTIVLHSKHEVFESFSFSGYRK